MKLRRKTGYSFVNCKKALEACDGDLQQVGGAGAAPPGAMARPRTSLPGAVLGGGGHRRDLLPSVPNDRAQGEELGFSNDSFYPSISSSLGAVDPESQS